MRHVFYDTYFLGTHAGIPIFHTGPIIQKSGIRVYTPEYLVFLLCSSGSSFVICLCVPLLTDADLLDGLYALHVVDDLARVPRGARPCPLLARVAILPK